MINQIFNNAAPERTAIITETGAAVTYSKLAEDIAKITNILKDRDLIFIICRNDYVSLLFYLAALDVGAVPLLLNAENQVTHLKQLVELYSPKFILAPTGIAESQNDFSEISRHDDYTFFRSDNATCPPLHKDLSFLATTSGSTGDPKLVRLSATNLKSNAVAIAEYLNITPDDRAITSLPISYSYGLSVINSHLLAGASIVLSDRSLMEREFWQQINSHEVTSFAGVPYHYEMMLRLGLKRLKIPTIKKMTQAGGRLSSENIEKVHTFCGSQGIEFWTMYGQTEASPRISYLPCDDTVRKLGSIGLPVPGGKLWLEDQAGNDISASGEIGELIYEGENVCMGYAYDKDDLAKGDVNQKRLSTGDLARCDDDGYFYLEGRLGRFLKIFGNRISLDQIEKFLDENNYQCAAHGYDDQLIVHVVGEQGLDKEDIKRKLSLYAGINMTAILVEGIKELPRLATGKVDYQCLTKAQ